jgi:hypothetical protein
VIRRFVDARPTYGYRRIAALSPIISPEMPAVVATQLIASRSWQ